MNPIDKELIDLQSLIETNTNWSKLPYIPFHVQEIIEFISNTTKIPDILFLGYFNHSTMFSFTTILAIMIVILIAYQIYQCRVRKTKRPNITVRMPSLKELEQLQNLKDDEQLQILANNKF